jgi:hypothetical protein
MAQSDHTNQALAPKPSLDYRHGFNAGFDRGLAEGQAAQPYATLNALIQEQDRSRSLRRLAWSLAIALAAITFWATVRLLS